MLETVKRISYSFHAPYLVLGYEDDGGKHHLKLVNGFLLPDEDRFMLKLYGTEIVNEFTDNQQITISLLKEFEGEKLEEKRIQDKMVIHDRLRLPIYGPSDHVIKFEIVLMQGHQESGAIFLKPLLGLYKEKCERDLMMDDALNKSLVRVFNMAQSKMKSRTQKNEAYHFNFKYKICRMKEQGMTYQELASKYGVYHETIKDWYILYKVFGREGLSRKKAKELADKRIPNERKVVLAQSIINGEKTYRQILKEEGVSLSRLRNWVKRERKNK